MNENESLILSPQQKRLWARGPADYWAQCALLIEGSVEPEQVLDCLQTVVDRHEILATLFEVTPGAAYPLQLIDDRVAIDWQVDRLDNPDEETLEGMLRDRFDQASEPSVDLEKGPLVRACFTSLSDARAVLHLSMPSLLADARSLHLLFEELASALADQPLTDEEEVLQYFDFSDWLEEVASDEDAAAGEAYWKGTDASAPVLPFEIAANEERSGFRAHLRHALDGTTRRELDRLAADAGTDLTGLLHACWQILIHRLGNCDDVLVDYVFDFRKHEEFKAGIGPFAQAVPVSCTLNAAMPFTEAVAVVADAHKKALGWQEYLGSAAVPESGLAFEARHRGETRRAGDLRLRVLEIDAHSQPYKLKLLCLFGEQDLDLKLCYDPAAFRSGDVARIASMLLQLLDDVSGRPGAPIGSASLLSAEERDRLPAREEAPAPSADDACVHHLLEASIRANPDGVALSHGAAELSYAELGRRASRLALHLTELGVGPDVLVGLCLPRGFDQVVAVLAIHEAGGAYLPLNPDDPADRLAYMLEDSGISLAVTDRALSPLLGEKPELVLVDEMTDGVPNQTILAVEVGPDNLAYVIYTSGSTGRPKGVAVSHGAVVNYLRWAVEAYGVAEGNGAPVHSPIGFDLTVTSLFTPLVAGNTVHLMNEEDGVEQLKTFLCDRDALSLVKITPAHLALLAEWMPEAKAAGKVKNLVVGGEALFGKNLAFWQTHAPETRIINEYGPTEATVGCCTHTLTGDKIAPGPVPIGVPIDGLEMLLLDNWMGLLPVGVASEIHIGGRGLARGYLGRPGLTAERFVPHPYSKEPGARLYKTGDMARYLTDETHAPGTIAFLGRNDDQVKIRGFRIELGEVEAVLRQHPQLSDVAVNDHRDAYGGRRLVAYVVVAGADQPSVDALRGFLAERLPEYMIPALFVRLDALPLTGNGKVDRAALPAPDQSRPMMKKAYEAPRNDLEEALVEVWCEALNVEKVGIHDSFFALGGDSIRSVRVAALAGERGFGFTVQQLFQRQTIAELSEMLASGDNTAAIANENVKTKPFEMISEADRKLLPPDVEDAFPLSVVQLGMLFSMEEAGDSPTAAAYHNVNLFRFRFRFDRALMEQSIAVVLARHPALRASYHLTGYSEPLQLIHRGVSMDISHEDLSHLDRVEQEAIIEAHMTSENRNLVDVTTAPLMRVRFYDLGNDNIAFVFTEPHSISDGWSTHMTIGEIFSHYLPLSRGETPVEPAPLKAYYRDFVRLERDMLAAGKSKAFWQNKLSGRSVTHVPRWPKAMIGPAGKEDHKYDGVVPPDIMEGLHRLSQQTGASMRTVFFTAHLKVLSIITGRTDLMSGFVVNGRPETIDGDRIRGLFLNTVPFPFDMDSCSWKALVRKVHADEVEIQEHRRYPLADMQRAWGRESLLDIAFGYNHFHSINDLMEEGVITKWKGGSEGDLSTTQFPLMIIFVTRPDARNHVDIGIDYDVTQFPRAQIDALHNTYIRVLSAMSADPDAHHDAHHLLGEEEARRMLEPHGADRAEFPVTQCIHEIFEARVAEQPNAVALNWKDRRVTYTDVNKQANRWAHYLIGLGLGPEDRVAVMADRRPETVIAILAIVKAGAAYVPLDPTHPSERRDLILTDSGASWLMAAPESELEALPAGIEVLVMESDRVAGLSEENPRSSVSPDNIAYVIYTSGSTGKPKGCLNTHTNVVRLFSALESLFEFTNRDVWTLFHSFAFDFSIWEMWGPLTTGGRLVLVPYWVSRSPETLYSLLCEEGVTILNQTPSAFRQLIGHEQSLETPGRLSLRKVLLGGEALAWGTLEPWFDQHGCESPELLNMYGITETCVFITYRPVTEQDRGKVTDSPIGVPMADLVTYLLDARLHPVPVGVPGEIYVAGPGLARGYLNRAGLTAERFLPNPFGKAGSRLYRTGDLGRLDHQGEIIFMGRIDNQVNIRGFRIELGEVTACINSLDAVAEAAVIDRRDDSGEEVLVAYVVTAPGVSIDAAARAELEAKLPIYMIPAYFVEMDALPLTPNGKLDKKALPEPERTQSQSAYQAPRNDVETILTDTWAAVLGLEQVGIHDNFFDLGGDSIICIQIVARCRQAGLRVQAQQIFLHPTVEELAGFVETIEVTETDQGPVSGSFPLTPIQHDFFALDVPNRDFWNMPQLLSVHTTLDPERLEKVVVALIEHHDALRTRFLGETQEIPAESRAEPFIYVDLSGKPEQEIRDQTAQHINAIQTGFRLDRGDLVKLAYFYLGEDVPGRLLLVMHHLVTDAVSFRIFLEDLQRGYAQLEQGRPLAFPPKTTSYKHWSERLSAFVAEGGMDDEIDYWTDAARFRGRPLPLDSEAGPNNEQAMRNHHIALEAESTRALLQDVPSVYNTRINDVLLTALVRAFRSWTGEPRLLLDMEGHGREDLFDDVDLSRTIGWFTAMYPVYLDIGTDDDPGTQLKTVKEQLRKLPNKGIGYGLLRYLHPSSDVRARMNATPTPQISFNYIGQVDQTLDETSAFRGTAESPGLSHDPESARAHLLEINCSVMGAQLRMNWNYSSNHHRAETIETLAAAYMDALRTIIDHCRDEGAGGFTPSDFPELEDMDQEDLDSLVAEFGGDY